jgi:DNA-binding NarL/FixJ family response regulator
MFPIAKSRSSEIDDNAAGCGLVESMPATRTLVVDDHPLFRSGIATILATERDFEIVAAVASAREARDVAVKYALDLAVVDVLMPATSGVTLCHELFELQPSCKVLLLSAIDDPLLIAELFRTPACGFALKAQPPAEIVAAARRVAGGGRYVPPSVSLAPSAAFAPTDDRPFELLTRREREVFELLIRGYSNEDIAERLRISRRTAETHRQRVINKLSPHSIAQMQRIAVRLGGFGE